MSRNVLGSMIPKDRLELLAKIAGKLAADNPRGEEWSRLFEETLNKVLAPKPPEQQAKCGTRFFMDDPGFMFCQK